MEYLIEKLATDLILNMFQKRLWGAVVISDSHSSFLQMTNYIFIDEFVFLGKAYR